MSDKSDDSSPIICDLGSAITQTENQITDRLCGTFDYMAPENFEFKPYTPESDVWSLGILTYALVTGNRFPFPCLRRNDTIKKSKVLNHASLLQQTPLDFSGKEWTDISEDLIDLIS